MRKPTFTIDSRAYSSTLNNALSQDRRPGLPSPVPTPKRVSSEAGTFAPPQSFIGDVQEALKKSISNKPSAGVQDSLRRPAGRESTSHKWGQRLGLLASPTKPKPEPQSP